MEDTRSSLAKYNTTIIKPSPRCQSPKKTLFPCWKSTQGKRFIVYSSVASWHVLPRSLPTQRRQHSEPLAHLHTFETERHSQLQSHTMPHLLMVCTCGTCDATQYTQLWPGQYSRTRKQLGVLTAQYNSNPNKRTENPRGNKRR